jgi:hypothetical protein
MTASGPTGDVDVATLGAVLDRLIEQAHTVPPDQLSLLARADELRGVVAVRLWLVDYSGRELIPYGHDDAGRLAVDGTAPGRVFATGEPIEIRHDDRTSLWAPLVDGIDRMGVAEFELARSDERLVPVLTKLAALVATELVTRGRYTDAVTLTRRIRPMTLAAELQWGLLVPGAFATPEVRVAAALEPSYAVAGDAYDFAENAGVLHAAIFDAMGHDLSATLICGLVVGAYRNLRRRGAELTEVAAALDALLREQVADGGFATGVMLELDTRDGQVRYLNTGHPPPLLLREGRLVGRLEDGRSLPFGLGDLGKGVADVGSVRLQPGDHLMLYSDGMVEAHSAGGAGFGVERLVDFVRVELASGLPDTEVVRRLIHALVDHFGGRLGDDATVMIIQWRPSAS